MGERAAAGEYLVRKFGVRSGAGYRMNWIQVTQEQMFAASEASMVRGDLPGSWRWYGRAAME